MNKEEEELTALVIPVTAVMVIIPVGMTIIIPKITISTEVFISVVAVTTIISYAPGQDHTRK